MPLGAVVDIEIDLCALYKLLVESGQVGRRTGADQPGRRWAQGTGPSPVPGALQMPLAGH